MDISNWPEAFAIASVSFSISFTVVALTWIVLTKL